MLLIFPSKKESHVETPVESYVEKRGTAETVKPADWPYMELSGEILKNPPMTWKVYPDTKEGLSSVIDMEYQELKGAMNRSKDDIMRELVHLGTATLALWRKYASE